MIRLVCLEIKRLNDVALWKRYNHRLDILASILYQVSVVIECWVRGTGQPPQIEILIPLLVTELMKWVNKNSTLGRVEFWPNLWNGVSIYIKRIINEISHIFLIKFTYKTFLMRSHTYKIILYWYTCMRALRAVMYINKEYTVSVYTHRCIIYI